MALLDKASLLNVPLKAAAPSETITSPQAEARTNAQNSLGAPGKWYGKKSMMPVMEYRSAIAAGNQRFMEAFRRGDAGGLASLYTADGQLLPPQHGIITGRESIRAFWQGVLDTGLKAATLQTTEAKANGHFAVEVGRYTFLDADGQVRDAGKYVVVWRRDMDSWLLHQDIWNTDLPPAGQQVIAGPPGGPLPFRGTAVGPAHAAVPPLPA